eukprot:COSAG02_NODE_53908_length_299_cov_0.750000_1_plen_26_part_10
MRTMHTLFTAAQAWLSFLTDLSGRPV